MLERMDRGVPASSIVLVGLLFAACAAPVSRAPAEVAPPRFTRADTTPAKSDDVAGVRDVDGDGVGDDVDRCPDDPGEPSDGCPIPDTDGDGILDPDDRCPEVPETRNGHQDRDGCSDEVPPDLAKFTGTIKDVAFVSDSDVITPKGKAALRRAAAVLNRYPEIRIEISNHTDSTGSIEYKRELSRRRAAAVHSYLVTQGVEAARLTARGAGPDEPIDYCGRYPDDPDEASRMIERQRRQDIRTEFTILVE